MAPLRMLLAAAISLSVAGVAYGAEEPAGLPTLRMVFFTPADVEPPAGVQRRMTQIADYSERFFVRWMDHWKYQPANKKLFQRNGDGTAEVLFVKGEHRLASGRYDEVGFQQEVIEKAVRQYKISRNRHLWWIFVYLGDPPRRLKGYRGDGDSQNGGWAMLNYSSVPGEIRPGSDLGEGFNDEFTLKGCIHELGHAFGLPHIGPRLRRGLGNSLMGPQTDLFIRQRAPNKQKVYLTEASAAMLWKHPLFSGTAKDRAVMPDVQLGDYRATFDRKQRRITVSGKLSSNRPAHSVVIIDDMQKKPGPYWVRGYVGRPAEDGTFSVAIDEPAPSDGQFKIVFCFQNGAVTGDGKKHGFGGAIVKSYRFSRGDYRFGS
ncbi:MAG: hypothetical protein WKF75_17220 [Singulisphaera sp.]